MKLHKVLLSCLLLTAVAVIGMFVLPTEARAATEGYYTYTISNGEATITDCSASIPRDITIPSTLGGYPVTTIGESAFYGCESLRSVTMSGSVMSIGPSAFQACTGLERVIVGSAVESIGSYAFWGCDSLQSVTLGSNLTSIGNYAFYYCSDLTSVTMGSSVESVGYYAFCGCSGLTDVYYIGSEEQWSEVRIGRENDCLTDATIHYDCTCSHDYTADHTTCGSCGHVRVSLGIASAVLRPTCAGIYFKGAFSFDNEVQVIRYGIALSLKDETPIAEDHTTSRYTIGSNSVLVTNILDGGEDDTVNGKALIYARAYVLLEGGTCIYGDVVTVNLKGLVETVDASAYAELGSTAKEALDDMYQQFASTMDAWVIPNIKEYGI